MIKDQIQYRSQSLLNLARDYFNYCDNGLPYQLLTGAITIRVFSDLSSCVFSRVLCVGESKVCSIMYLLAPRGYTNVHYEPFYDRCI